MLIVIGITSFLASLLTLFSGFGLGTILMPVLALFYPVPLAVALTALVHFLNNIFKLATLYRYINVKVGLQFGLPALLAAIGGAWLLTTISFSNKMVGLLLILFACLELFHLFKKIKISDKHLWAGGLLSGFFGGLSGHQGAFRSAFLLHTNLSSQSFIATNAFIASLVDSSRLLVYGLNLRFLLQELEASMMITSVLAAFLGVIIGKHFLKKITIQFIHYLVATMLFALGLLLVFK